MSRIPTLPLVPALFAAALHAGEVTVEHQPFVIHHSFTASALPKEVSLFQLKAEAWSDYEIQTIADHGSKVIKGDVLVAFDAESIDKKLADARNALESSKLKLAQTELELKNLQETTPHKLVAWRRAAAEAKEANAYFIETRRKSDEEQLAESIKRNEQRLENAREELRQLTKMYEADDLTEETEEIILVRQRAAVESSEFALRMEQQDQKRRLEVLIPREAVKLAEAERDTAIGLAKAELDFPRAIQLKELELSALKTSVARETETLAKLESDRAAFELKAPADGWFYHGPIENGRWSLGELAKSLVIHGRAPVRKPFASFIPSTAALEWTAALDESTARSIGDGKPTGMATLTGREDLGIPVTLASLSTTPNAESRYRADFKAEWPEGITLTPGATATIRLVAYENKEAILLPVNAFAYGSDGWTVELKLADGKTERRPVTRGRVFNEKAEVLSGIEPGQVVLVP